MSVDPKKFGITPSLVDAVKLTLESKSLAALAPPRDKVTHKDILVGRGVLKKHPQDPDKHVVAKEEAEQVDELSDKTLQSYREKSHKDKKPREYGRAMAFAKQTGIGAKVKATKEEVEQVDELSKKTLGSYATKAADSAATHTGAAAAYGSSSKHPDAAKMAQHQAKAAKRTVGLQKAVGKLTKEDVNKDVEKVNRATGAAAAAAIRSADPVISKMKDSNPQMHKALTKTTNPGNIFTGSRYGDKGVAEAKESGPKVKDEYKNFHDKFKSHSKENQAKITSNLKKGMSYKDAIKNVSEADGSSNPSTSSSALDKINSIATDMKKMASEPLKPPKDPGAVKKLPNVNAPGAPDMFKTEAVADPMAAKKAEVQKKIAQKQATAVQARANKRMSNINASNDKCSCDSTNESKMKCEVHNGNGMKGGKEKIEVNPPLREAEDLPKKVITKGHEIAKSLIKNRAKVREPYAVGMAQAKKSAGIKN
jgi:hypothetical protein